MGKGNKMNWLITDDGIVINPNHISVIFSTKGLWAPVIKVRLINNDEYELHKLIKGESSENYIRETVEAMMEIDDQ